MLPYQNNPLKDPKNMLIKIRVKSEESNKGMRSQEINYFRESESLVTVRESKKFQYGNREPGSK